MSFYDFAGAHPVLVFFLALLFVVLVGTVSSVVRSIFTRAIRHLNIRKAGWPPAPLDADGDWKPENVWEEV